jgi:hypothetical protein
MFTLKKLNLVVNSTCQSREKRSKQYLFFLECNNKKNTIISLSKEFNIAQQHKVDI